MMGRPAGAMGTGAQTAPPGAGSLREQGLARRDTLSGIPNRHLAKVLRGQYKVYFVILKKK